MCNISNEELKQLCLSAERYTDEELEQIIHWAEVEHTSGHVDGGFGLLVKPDFIKTCVDYLKKSPEKVKEIIKSEPEILDVICSIFVDVILPQLTGNEMGLNTNIAIIVLTYLFKKGIDKFIS